MPNLIAVQRLGAKRPDDCIEVFRKPASTTLCYAEQRKLRRGEQVDLVEFPGATLQVSDLLPSNS